MSHTSHGSLTLCPGKQDRSALVELCFFCARQTDKPAGIEQRLDPPPAVRREARGVWGWHCDMYVPAQEAA